MNKYSIPIVRIILEDLEGKILLLKRASKVGNSRWCLPGGKVDFDKTLEQACISEAKEETGLDISNLKFLFYQDGLPAFEGESYSIIHYFTADYSGNLSLNKESSEADWVHPNNLKKYDIAFNNDKAINIYLFDKN